MDDRPVTGRSRGARRTHVGRESGGLTLPRPSIDAARTRHERGANEARPTCESGASEARVRRVRDASHASRTLDSRRARDAKTAFSSAFGTFLRARRAFFIVLS
jgi:hypothetical protein